MMEQLLPVLVALILVSLCRASEDSGNTPQFELVDKTPEFEERLYVATDWITTKLEGNGNTDVITANTRLKDYCLRQNEAGYEIPTDKWPALITITEGGGAPLGFLSWFIPPGTRMPENTDSSVIVQHKPRSTVYVRLFGGIPNLESGQENAEMLRKALVKAGKTFDSHTYTGAGYESIFSATHHNEIWIQAAGILT